MKANSPDFRPARGKLELLDKQSKKNIAFTPQYSPMFSLANLLNEDENHANVAKHKYDSLFEAYLALGCSKKKRIAWFFFYNSAL
jgi:poly-D-alanine transfer protein DltD